MPKQNKVHDGPLNLRYRSGMPDISMSTLFAGVLFGALGFAGWQIGRKRQSMGKMLIGVALMVFPYVVPDGIWVWLVGAGLTVALYYA